MEKIVTRLGHCHAEKVSPIPFPTLEGNYIIDYQIFSTQLGKVLAGYIPQGLCYLAPCQNDTLAIATFQRYFASDSPSFRNVTDERQIPIQKFMGDSWENIEPLSLYLRGTPFQQRVWRALLDIPIGEVRAYGEVAQSIGQPTATRAVGNAVGRNPIAYIIPCHRVITATHQLGNFHWGRDLKSNFLKWESVLHF